MGGVGQEHDGHARPEAFADERRRVLWLVLIVNAVYLVVEVVGGFLFDSLSLLADGAHMFSDVTGLGIALIAQALVLRPASPRHSYGLQRAEVLGALANGVLLVASAGWIIVEALRRIGDAPDVNGGGLLAVAVIGLVINLVSAVALSRSAGRSLNMRAAVVHSASDAAASLGVIVAALAIVFVDATWADPAISIGIGVLVLVSAWGLLRETTHVLLEGTPRNIGTDEVVATLLAEPEVVGVHHVHLWNLASETTAMSAHIVLEGPETLHDAQERGDELRVLLEERFGIEHATLELECHPCDDVQPRA